MRVVRVLVLAVLCLLSAAVAAQANTLTVTTTSDSPVPFSGSLRDVVSRASPGDTVVLPESTNHYDISLGEITITKPLTIASSDPASAIIDAHGTSRVFHVTASPGSESTVTFQNVTVTGGRTTSAPGGGGILVDPSSAAPIDLSLLGAVINANSATVASSSSSAGGGGVYSSGGAITLQGSTASDDTATVTGIHCCHGGGAIYDNGPPGRAPLIVSHSHLNGDSFTLNGNSADLGGSSSNCCSGGGAVYQNSDSNTTVDASQLTGDSATITSGQCCHGGGAVFLDYGSTSNDTTSLTGSHLDGNTVTVNGPSGTSGSQVAHCCSGGGALATFLGFTATGSTMSANVANINSGDCCQGGGAAQIHNQRQSVALYGTSLSDNRATMNSSACCSGGGAIQYDAASGSPGPLSTRGSAVTGNTASFTSGATPSASGGGGIYDTSPGGDTFTNSTIAGNTTNASGSGQGGGGLLIHNAGAVPATFANATVGDNSASGGSGDGVFSQGSRVQSKNSILARNGAAAGGGCAATGGGSFSSLGYNLEDAPDTCGLGATGDQVVTPAALGLGGLAANNAETPSEALLPGSPAIDAGNPAGCTDPFGALLETDQRGYPRPSGARCDIGAFELQQPHAAHPRCAVRRVGRAVRLTSSRNTRPRNRVGARIRAISAVLNCDQPATVRIKALFRVGKKPRFAKRFGTRPVVVSVAAHVRKRVTVKLPGRAVKALKAHARLLCHLLLVVANGNGMRYQSVRIGYLMATG